MREVMRVFRKRSGEDGSAGLPKSGAETLIISKLRVTEKAVAVKAENGDQMCAPPEPAAIRGGRAAVRGVGMDFSQVIRFGQKGEMRNIYGEGEDCGGHMQALSAGDGGDMEQGRGYHGGVL